MTWLHYAVNATWMRTLETDWNANDGEPDDGKLSRPVRGDGLAETRRWRHRKGRSGPIRPQKPGADRWKVIKCAGQVK